MTQMQDSRLFGARSALARGIRNTVLKLLGRAGVFERRIIPDLAQVVLRYRRSPLAVGRARRSGRYRPGMAVPDVEFALAGSGTPLRLRAVSAQGPLTLIAVPGTRGSFDTTELAALADRCAGRVQLLRSAAPLPETKRQPRRGYLLAVRPDGYVGYRGGAGAVRAWLEEAVALDLEPAVRTRTVAERERLPA